MKKNTSNPKSTSYNKKGMGTTTNTPANIPIPVSKKAETFNNANDKKIGKHTKK